MQMRLQRRYIQRDVGAHILFRMSALMPSTLVSAPGRSFALCGVIRTTVVRIWDVCATLCVPRGGRTKRRSSYDVSAPHQADLNSLVPGI